MCLTDLAGRIDLALIDAPCTGTGAWRRNPDAKWRVRPGASADRLKQQEDLLDRAVPLLKAGGRIAYVTCSVLPEENGDQVARLPGPAPRLYRGAAARIGGRQPGRAELHVLPGRETVG